MKRTMVSFVVAFAILAAVAGGLALTSTPAAAAKPCGICPLVCSPGICDNGQTYCNSCLASCAGAHGCHPL